MKIVNLVLRLVLILSAAAWVFAQDGDLLRLAPGRDNAGFRVFVPPSTVERPEDVGTGLRAHTNHLLLVAAETEEVRPLYIGTRPYGETPATLRSVYKLPSTGGAGVIALVDAYDYPTAENDLGVFSRQFGLPSCTTANGCFKKVYASGRKPAANCSWAQEAALDLQWAHAMAPNARIVFVEAASNLSTDLMQAVDVANNYVSPTGAGFGEVSMSWGFSEFAGETAYDTHFKRNGVVYFASSGDVGGTRIYPCESPYVVCVGGTTIHRSSTGAFQSEMAWSSSGGGASVYELRPSFQGAVSTVVGTHRGAPDLSFDADPNSGVAAYDSTACNNLSGWLTFGGTSLSAPAVAGVINLAGHFYHTTALELGVVYSYRGTSNYRDIVSGTAGGYSAKAGWDFITGVGSPLTSVGK